MGLYDYFQSQGQSLPSVEQRRQMYGLGSDYMGTAAQNAALLQRLQGGGGGQAPAPMAPTPAQPAQASSSLFSQYQSQLAPITAQSDQLLKDYYALAAQAPSFAQKLLDSIKQSEQYPSQAAMREEYAQNPNLTPMAIESLVSRRGQSTRGTIQDIISRATGGFESDITSRQAAAQQSQQQRANLLEEYGLARQEQQDILAAKKAAGTGVDLSWIKSITDLFKQPYKPTEKKPGITPSKEGVFYTSPGGQWKYSWNQEDWIPIVDY